MSEERTQGIIPYPGIYITMFSPLLSLNGRENEVVISSHRCPATTLVHIHVHVSLSVVSDSWQPHGLQPTRLLCPWNSPGKNTGVGCHVFIQRIFLTQGVNLDLLHCKQVLQSEPREKPLLLVGQSQLETQRKASQECDSHGWAFQGEEQKIYLKVKLMIVQPSYGLPWCLRQ